MTTNSKIQEFLTGSEAEFEITATHDNFNKVMETIRINYLIGKKEKLQAIKVKENILFVRNGNLISDYKAVQNGNNFDVLSLTTSSLNRLEAMI